MDNYQFGKIFNEITTEYKERYEEQIKSKKIDGFVKDFFNEQGINYEILMPLCRFILEKIQSFMDNTKNPYFIYAGIKINDFISEFLNLCEKCILKNFKQTILIIKKYFHSIYGIRELVVPSIKFTSIFGMWNTLEKFSKENYDNYEKLKEKIEKDSRGLQKLFESFDDSLEIDYYYGIFETLGYYEVSRSLWGLFLGLYDILNDIKKHPNEYFSKKILTSDIIRKFAKNYVKNNEETAVNKLLLYYKDINKEIRNFAAHHAFDPNSKHNFANNLITDSDDLYSTSAQLLGHSAILLLVLLLVECWCLLIYINMNYKKNITTEKEKDMLYIEMLRLINFIRPEEL